MADSILFQAASFYRDKGLSILPCRLFFDAKGKCKKPPLIKEWLSLQKKQVSMMDFQKWKPLFRDEPGRGVAIITGVISNLVVLDIDSQEAFDGVAHLIKNVHTVTVKTPGGWHYYFKFREGFGNNVGIDPSSGLDIRAEGGYVCAPPSQYPDGRPYKYFTGGKFVDQSSVSPMPEELYQHLQKLLIEKKKHGGKRAGSGRKGPDESRGSWFTDMMLNGVQKGSRTASMVEAEGYMLGRKVPREMIETFITLFNKSLPIDEQLTEHELREEVIPAIDRIAGDIEDKTVNRLNETISLVTLESGERVISEIYYDFKGTKKIRFAKKDHVRESYLHKTVLINKKPECIFDIWRTSPDKKIHNGIIFDPSAKPWEDDGHINLWKGFKLEPKEGDWSLYKKHIEEVISTKHHEWIIQWMARIVQDPGGKRPGTVIVLRGDQGTGKGVFANTFGALLGTMEYYFAVNKIGDLTGKFNEDLKTALLLFIDEATWGGDKEASGVLKSLVTEPTRRIEPKGINAFHVDNFLNLIIASNNRWVVPGGANERRFFVLDVPNTKQQDIAYFEAITKQMFENDGLAAMFYDLLRVKVDHKLIAKIPVTQATGDQITQGLELEEKFWYERLEIGTLVDKHTYWKKLSVNETLYSQYDEYCQSKNRTIQQLGRRQFGTFLNRIIDDIVKKKKTSPDGTRYMCRILPDLTACRKMFSKKFGIKGDWPELCEQDNISDTDRLEDLPGPHYRQKY